MKAAIAAEVARKDLADDIKRGPGGIREIEFLAQALQLIHGGRNAELRGRSLLRALHALCEANHLSVEARDLLVAARSDEHTSELQSLMRISYAVFCLKKKTST